MGLFIWSGPERPVASGEPVARPTFFQHLTGTGEYMTALGKARKNVSKGFFQQVRRFQKEKRGRTRDFAKDLAKQKERYFRRAGLSDLATRPATKAELGNSRVKYFVKEFAQREEHMRRNFDRSEWSAREDMRRDYHKQLREASMQIRRQGPAAFKSQPKSTISPMDHFFGRGSSSRRPDTSRRGLSI